MLTIVLKSCFFRLKFLFALKKKKRCKVCLYLFEAKKQNMFMDEYFTEIVPSFILFSQPDSLCGYNLQCSLPIENGLKRVG